MKSLKLFLILAGINLLLVVGGFIVGVNDFSLLLVSVFCIILSTVVFIVVGLLRARKSYLNKNVQGRKRARKMALVIAAIILLVLATGWIILCVRSGYMLPGKDKHKEWKYFPEGSNPEIHIKPVDSLYIYNMLRLKGTPYFAAWFTTDSTRFNDYNSTDRMSFGIIDNNGVVKLRYDSYVSVYADDGQVYVLKEFDSKGYGVRCDVYHTQTLKQSVADILPVPIPVPFDLSGGETEKAYVEKHGNNFFSALKGIKSFEEAPVYAASDKGRGYGLYKGPDGRLYSASGDAVNYSLRLLCGCTSYEKEAGGYGVDMNAPNIRTASPPIVHKNHISSGFSVGFGNPNGGYTGPYFSIYRDWTFYFTASLGDGSMTSFKVEGGEKDWPYTRFYQLNKPVAGNEPLYVAADGRIWKIYKR